MSQKGSMLATKPDTLSWILESTQWKKRNDYLKLTSDLHEQVYIHTPTQIKT